MVEVALAAQVLFGTETHWLGGDSGAKNGKTATEGVAATGKEEDRR